MPQSTSPLTAFAVASLGIALFSAMDAVMKGMTLAMGVYLAMLWRMGTVAVVSGIPYFARGPRWPAWRVLRLHLVRGLLTALMATLFFWGLARVPMAQAVALAFIAPLVALFLAALLLGERIGRTAVLASGIAFAGVATILFGQTQGALGPEALWGALAILASALCYAWNIVLMRQQAQVAGPLEVAFFQGLIVALTLLPAAPWLGGVPPAAQWPAVIGSAVLATASNYLLTWAYARAPASYLAPTEYTAFLWATLLGWLVFGEHVSLYTLSGAGLIVGGCALAARGGHDHGPPDAEAGIP